MLHSMRKRKLTSPLSWFFEPKTTVADLLGTKLTTVEFTPCKFTIDIKEGNSPSGLAGKRIDSISNWSCWDRPTWNEDWFSWPTTYSFTIGGKPTLKVTKKEDIKFV